MKYMLIDDEGLILGFFDPKICTPPINAISISEQEWEKAFEERYTHYKKSSFSRVEVSMTRDQILTMLTRAIDDYGTNISTEFLGHESSCNAMHRARSRYDRAIDGDYSEDGRRKIIQEYMQWQDKYDVHCDLAVLMLDKFNLLADNGELGEAEKVVRAYVLSISN